jgi:flagellar protein FlgJ
MDSVSKGELKGLAPRVTRGGTDPALKKKEEDKKLNKACAQFEAFFVYYMLKTMRESIPKSGLMGNFAGRDSYNMMLDQQVADKVASRGDGLGIRKMILNDLNKIKK